MAFNNNYGNPIQRSSPIVFNLIIINVLVFLVQMMMDGNDAKITSKIALWPYDFPNFEPYQLVTHMFAHASIFHILFNMYALWMLGAILERVWGSKRFLIFYLVCGLGSGVTQMLLSNGPSVGASGAIMGCLGAFAYLFPNTQFYIIPFPFPIKAKYMALIMAGIDLFGGLHPGGTDNIAHFAHLGGLVVGFVLVLIWNKTNKRNFY
jgi:membrane associated rhomboid family serine protease